MLKNQDAVPEPPISVPATSVAQARVTPNELASALAAIEARRQAEAAHLAGTIPIEQAVSDLHLDSTSDEIWAEVQKQRDKAAAAQKAERQEAEPQQNTQGQKFLFRRGPSPPVMQVPKMDFSKTRRRGWRGLIAPVLVIGVLMGTGVIPHNFTPHGFSPSLLTTKPSSSGAAPVLTPLSAVPDGTEVFADDTALLQISKGKPAAQTFVSRNSSSNSWTLVKMNGHVYLHGFTVSADSLTALAGEALPVYNDDDSGEFHEKATSNITLRVDRVPLEKSGGDDDYSSIIVPDFRPDSFTTLTPGP